MTVEDALLFAEKAHYRQTRRNGEAYINHPRRVLRLLQQIGAPLEVQIAGVLHDVVEDCGVTFAQLEAKFGSAALMVAECTKLPDGSFPLKTEWGRMIKLCDAFDNCTDTETTSLTSIRVYNHKKRKLFGIDR